ncbi:hypothetical protein XELAEV_18032254mg [Xenopus laevis]|uniref:Uncharacterized protein n=1 Tax=Xenopus laevis TaxID=8355 RepID=A0A974HGF7_XENLA|nr:hypothetical protein XELAEV_18032254mg [Xenopus laevis]
MSHGCLMPTMRYSDGPGPLLLLHYRCEAVTWTLEEAVVVEAVEGAADQCWQRRPLLIISDWPGPLLLHRSLPREIEDQFSKQLMVHRPKSYHYPPI